MKNEIDDEYYKANYDLVFDYIQKEKTGGYEIVNGNTGDVVTTRPFYFKDSLKKCRYCGKMEPEVTFKDKAHTYPEFLGNKFFVNKNNECDVCNHKFGDSFEQDLRALLKPILAVDEIKGKGGQAKYKSNDGSLTSTYEEGKLVVKQIAGANQFRVNEEKKEIYLDIDVQEYNLFNVYKSLLKMMIYSVNESELSHLQNAIKALDDPNKQGAEVFYFVFYPGYNQFNFEVTLHKKKDSIKDYSIPTYQFTIRNQNLMLQIPVFSDIDIKNLVGRQVKIDIKPLPTEFDITSMGNAKVSYYPLNSIENIVPKQTKTITLSFDLGIMVSKNEN